MGDDLTREQVKAGESHGRGSPRRRCSVAQAKSSQRAGSHSAGPDASSVEPPTTASTPTTTLGAPRPQVTDLRLMPPSRPGSGHHDWLRRRPYSQASRIPHSHFYAPSAVWFRITQVTRLHPPSHHSMNLVDNTPAPHQSRENAA